jgi:hypothetical protein
MKILKAPWTLAPIEFGSARRFLISNLIWVLVFSTITILPLYSSQSSHADTVVLEHGTESKEMHVHSGVLRKEPWSDQSNVTIQYLLGGYKSPSTIAVDGEGSIYVANYRATELIV